MLSSGIINKLKALALAPLLALALVACGGGGSDPAPSGSTPPPAQKTGTLLVGLTDADGDFLSYAVDVVSLTLQKADGTVVNALPTRQRVDFVELVSLSELVTAATIPTGVYTRASIRLDFANADVSVEVGGEAKAATVVDKDGNPLGVVDLAIRLDNRNHVNIQEGIPALLQLDFDLAATHRVDISSDPVIAKAAPFVVATIQPVDEKEIRVRGPLVSVDTAASNYLIDIRPFLHTNARHGQITVNTNAETTFEIDGVEFEGAAGLAAMAALPAGARTAAFGVLSTSDRKFTALRVFAASSVVGDRFDVLVGNVIARDGNELTVRGGTMFRVGNAIGFVRGDITVLISDQTKVTRDGGGRNLLRPIAISVGQRIHAFGQASQTGDAWVLDATQGRVRMNITHLLGRIVSSNPGNLALDLAAIDGRRVEIFNFAGTGSAPAVDADPDNYEVATAALDLNRLVADAPVRVFGFVTPFGFAPPDFFGRTVVDFIDLRAELGIGWTEAGTSAPFLRMGADGLVIDQNNTDLGERHHIKFGHRIIDITQLANPVTVVPASGKTLFAIGRGDSVEVFREFAPFAEALSAAIGGGGKLRAMHARGGFSADGLTINANYVAVSMVAGN